LVPRDFMARHALNVGDAVRVAVSTDEGIIEPDLRIVGSFDLFPTWYPEGERGHEPLFVGNLDHVFERAEGQFPYDVWIAADADADYERIVAGLRASQITVLGWDAPVLEISKAQQRPERQGLFGLLSVGFLSTALLTALGFLLYAFFSFRRRFIEMGVLRAIGLSLGQMVAFLAWELAFLVLLGVIAGTGLGVWVSLLFIPYLQVGAGPSAYIPPYVVEIAWSGVLRIYALFGLLFVVSLAGLTALLLRMRIFQAIKLGDTT
jgi:putative ABC transport system permease protein